MSSRWLRSGLFAALDQAWLSFLNFAISIALIRYGEKEEYGLYVLLLSPLLLAQGIQNALFLSPFATLYPQRQGTGQAAAIRYLVWGQLAFIVLVAICGYLSLIAYGPLSGINTNTSLPLAFAAAIVGTLTRESLRSFQYATGQSGIALLGDLVYGAVILAGLAYLYLQGSPSVTTILAITGLAGILPMAKRITSRRYPDFGLPPTESAAFWTCGRWALVGVGIAWVNLNSYPYFAATLGVSAVAEINAARLFMMPVLLALPAWSNLFRPKFARWYAEGKRTRMRNISLRSAALGGTAVAGYAALIAMAYPWLEPLLGPAYRDIQPLVMAWALVYIFSTVRTTLMATLMVEEAGYRALSRFGVITLLCIVPAMLIATRFGALWLIVALALAEAIQLALMVGRARAYWGSSANA